MATRYFRKQNPQADGPEIHWIEMSGMEFYTFVKSPESQGRHFISLDDDIVIEANDKEFQSWVIEKNHSDYLRRCEAGIETVSLYSDMVSEYGSGEELVCDSVDIEEQVMTMSRSRALQEAVNQLDSENIYLLYRLYFSKTACSENKLAKELGITQQAVHKRKKKILEKLKKLVVKSEKSQQYIVKGKNRKPLT